MKQLMSKIILYILTFGMMFLVNQYYIQPSIKKDKHLEDRPESKPSKKAGFIPELISEKHNG
jgi:hypothetical protein